MKRTFFILLAIVCLSGCRFPPENFTSHYKNENTGLDQLIDIDGYYISQRGCDSTFFSIYMFYPDELFTIATTSHLWPGLIECFEAGGTSAICQYPLWGTYRLEGNLIKTQVIRPEGNGCVIFRDYRILPGGSIVNVSDYVQPSYTNLGYMENYPSFTNNLCEKAAEFHPLKSKRSPSECPFLKKHRFLQDN